MEVLPLQRWRFSASGLNGDLVPRYGNQSYLTVGQRFVISYVNGGWRVTPNDVTFSISRQLIRTGLFYECFPRRKDAISALTVSLEMLDTSDA